MRLCPDCFRAFEETCECQGGPKLPDPHLAAFARTFAPDLLRRAADLQNGCLAAIHKVTFWRRWHRRLGWEWVGEICHTRHQQVQVNLRALREHTDRMERLGLASHAALVWKSLGEDVAKALDRVLGQKDSLYDPDLDNQFANQRDPT